MPSEPRRDPQNRLRRLEPGRARDAYCRHVLAKHWPDVPRFDDVRTVGAHNLSRVDVLGVVRVHGATGDLYVTAEYTGHQDVATLLARYLSAPKGRADDLASRITWAPAALRVVESDE